MFWSDFPIFSVNPSTLVAGLTTVCTAVFQSRTRPVTWAVSTWSTLSHTSCRTPCPAPSLYPGHLRLMLATPATPGHHPSELRVRTSSPGLWVSMTTAWRTRWWWTTDCPRTTMTLTTPAAVSSPSILHWPDEILVIILLSVWNIEPKIVIEHCDDDISLTPQYLTSLVWTLWWPRDQGMEDCWSQWECLLHHCWVRRWPDLPGQCWSRSAPPGDTGHDHSSSAHSPPSSRPSHPATQSRNNILTVKYYSLNYFPWALLQRICWESSFCCM